MCLDALEGIQERDGGDLNDEAIAVKMENSNGFERNFSHRMN